MNLTHQYVQTIGPVVICDTMVWRKGIPNDIKHRFSFAATWLSVYELFKTKDKRPGVIINTWERIRDDSVYIMPMLPAQHLDFYLSAGKVIDNKYFEMQRADAGAFNDLIARKKANTLSNEDWVNFLSVVESIRNNYTADFNLWMDQTKVFKDEHKPIEGRGDFEEKSILIKLKKDFLRTEDGFQDYWEKATRPLLLTFLGEGYKPILSEFSKFELFINVFNKYLIDIDLGAYTATVNDLIDIFNMVYVTPVDKYWTEEIKWINIITDLGLNNYLFNSIGSKS